LSPRTVSDLERGVSRAPHRQTVALLAKALGLEEVQQGRLATSVSRHRRVTARASAMPDQLLSSIPAVLTPLLGRERDEAFDEEVGEFDEESEFGDAGDEAVEVFSDAVLHELDLLPLHELALGVVGAAFGLARFFGDGVKFFERDRSTERRLRLAEAIELIHRLWTEERVTFDGTYYKTQNATIYDRPPGGIPLLIAAGGPQMAKYAGRAGDGFICTSGKGAELYRDQLLPAFQEGARESGRDPSKLDKMIEVKVSFDTDRQRALEDTRHWGALALTSQEKVGVEDPIEMERLADALPTERTASRWIVSTDPEEHVEQIRFYSDLGFNHQVFHAPGPDQRRFLDLYADKVLPLLRRVAAPA